MTMTQRNPSITKKISQSANDEVAVLFEQFSKNGTMVEMIGWRYIGYDNDELSLGFTPKPFFCNPMGMIHGGFIASMLDETMGSSIFATTLGKKIGATISTTIDYIRPAMLGDLRTTGRVRKLGRSIAFVEAELWSEGAKLLAKSTASFKIVNLSE